MFFFKFGQISHFWPTVKIGEGWAKCVSQSEVQSSFVLLTVEVSDFLYVVPFLNQRIKDDWCRKSIVTLALFTPSVTFSGVEGEMNFTSLAYDQICDDDDDDDCRFVKRITQDASTAL